MSNLFRIRINYIWQIYLFNCILIAVKPRLILNYDNFINTFFHFITNLQSPFIMVNKV